MLNMNVIQNFKPNLVGSTAVDSFNELPFSTSAISSDTEKYVYINDEYVSENIKPEDVGKYTVFDIANWFLSKAPMTHKKLQKLCYYAQAWCYALNDYRLERTDFQAWVHGPVSPALWNRFKEFGMATIRLKNNVSVKLDKKDVELLENVWDTYGDESGNALEILTHREIPWITARKGYGTEEKCTVVISPELMRTFYRSIYIGK